MKKIILILALGLIGCSSATMVKPINTGSKYAPMNEAGGIGEVVYLQEGAESIIESRREDAYKKMYGQCNGKYETVKEWVNSELSAGGVSQATVSQSGGQGGSTFYAGQINYRHIAFKCQ